MNELVIKIDGVDPQDFKKQLLKALNSHFRHMANNPNKWNEDDEHMLTITRLIDSILEEIH